MSKEVIPAVNTLTDVAQCRKRSNNNTSAIFVHMVPTVDHQVERERDLRAVMLLHKHPESNDNATETRKGKQEQRQQQCYCCYICQHYKPKHPRKACCMAVSYIYFDKPVGRKENFFVELVQTHCYI